MYYGHVKAQAKRWEQPTHSGGWQRVSSCPPSTAYIRLLWSGVIQLILYAKGTIVTSTNNLFFGYEADDVANIPSNSGGDKLPLESLPEGVDTISQEGSRALSENSVAFFQDPLFLYLALICFIIFIVVACVAVWRLSNNESPKL